MSIEVYYVYEDENGNELADPKFVVVSDESVAFPASTTVSCDWREDSCEVIADLLNKNTSIPFPKLLCLFDGSDSPIFVLVTSELFDHLVNE